VIGRFYIGKHYYILHALSNKKDNLVVFNMADFGNLPNHQNKFYAILYGIVLAISYLCNTEA